MEGLRKSFLLDIEHNKDLQQRVIDFYMLPNTITDTSKNFNLRICEVKYILELNKIQEHNKEIIKKLTNEKKIKNSLVKYGVKSPNQLAEIKEKKRKIYQEKYGVNSPVQLEKAKTRREQAYLENKELIKKKRENTFLERYGEKNAIASKQVRDKIKDTNIKKYGVDNPLKLQEVQDKCKKTMLERYGVEHPAQSSQVIEKMKSTSLQRYGKEYYTQTEEYKERVKLIKEEKIKKLKKYFKDTYGVDWITQSPIFIDKCLKTKKQNKTFNTSKPELYVKDILENIFGKDNVLYQYKDERYPYECDFYVKNLDMFIECNFHWTHMFHPFDIKNEDDLESKRLLEQKAKTSQFYANALNVWTVRDVNKLQTALKNNLNYVVLYNDQDLEKFLNLYDR